MFDRITLTPQSGSKTVTVHEHRAPTDESVRLLADIQREAEARIVKSIRIETNVFKGVVYVAKDFISDSTEIKVVFDLNGKRLEARASLSQSAFEDNPSLSLAKEAQKAVLEALSAHITIDLFSKLDNPKIGVGGGGAI